MSNVKTAAVETNGGSMGYCVFGTGEKILVMLPGLSIKSVLVSAAGIAAAFSGFRDEYTVFLFDRRSDIPEGYSVRGMAEDTVEAVKRLGISFADFFGVSQGGMIAQVIAAEHPELVHKLVLGSTADTVTDRAASVIKKWEELAEKKDRKALGAAFAEDVYSKEFNEKYGKVIAEFVSDASDDDLERFCRLANACDGFSSRELLKKIKCPVLVLGAEDDMVVGCEASVSIAEKTGGELYIYKGCGHAVYDEAPDYKSRIFEFLRK